MGKAKTLIAELSAPGESFEINFWRTMATVDFLTLKKGKQVY